MNVKKRLISGLLLSLFLFCALLTPALAADGSTKTYVYNEYGEAVCAPSAYLCTRVLRGRDLGLGDFSKLTDLYVNGNVYLSDSGNNRIVVLSPEYELVRVISEVQESGAASALNSPSSVFLADGLLYICDTGNSRVVAVDSEDRVVKTFCKPASDLLTEDFAFKPSKVVVNRAGSVYIAASGVYQGLLHYESDGSFIEFFGANKVEVTAAVLLKSMWMNIFSDEQRESLIRTVPTEYAGIFIDSEDMIYTTTVTASTSQVKRLNASGENILIYPGSSTGFLQKGYDRNNFGDQILEYAKGSLRRSQIMDVTVDGDNVIAVLDSSRGRVLLFDSEQNTLGIFGGSGTQDGCFTNASALAKNGGEYLVADGTRNSVTVFAPTEYMQNIRCALRAYGQGEYSESRAYWERVLESNAGLSVAAKGVGRALLLEGNFRDAMRYLKMGDDRYYYSMALTRYRREFLRENSLWLVPCVIVAAAAVCIGLRQLYLAILRSGKGREK